MAGGKLRKHRRYFVEKNIVGGRGGTRTRGPLLAKQVGKNTKCFCWCRLQRKLSKFRLLNCPEVVPRYSKFCWCRLHGQPSKFPLFNCPEVIPNFGSLALFPFTLISHPVSAGILWKRGSASRAGLGQRCPERPAANWNLGSRL